MQILLLLTIQIALVLGRSSGAPICDAMGVCMSGKCPDGMDKVAPPTRNVKYTVRTGDGDPKDDPVSYVPGEIMDIHFRTLDTDGKFIGILIYAVDAEESPYPASGCSSPGCDGNQEFKVGEFIVAAGEKVQATCNGQAITHIDANKKNFHLTLHWKAPETEGRVFFRAVIKVGPTQGGYFYWPMNKDLTLTSKVKETSAITWVQSKPGVSCKKACRMENKVCDAESMNDVDVYDEFKSDFVCPQPLLSGCSQSGATPFMDVDGDCYTKSQSCETKQASCSTKVADCERFCACKSMQLSGTKETVETEGEVMVSQWSYLAAGSGLLLGCAVALITSRRKHHSDDLIEDLYMDINEVSETAADNRKI